MQEQNGNIGRVRVKSKLSPKSAATHVGTIVALRRIVLRIGINLGDIVIDGDDIHGDGVNVAARLQAASEAGRRQPPGATGPMVIKFGIIN